MSNTLDAGFCTEALEEALTRGKPDVFNTDPGSQFSSLELTQVLQDRGVKISMDGKGRYEDNIFGDCSDSRGNEHFTAGLEWVQTLGAPSAEDGGEGHLGFGALL